MRNNITIIIILLLSIVASVGTVSAGTASDGQGTMEVSPNSVTVGSTGNSFSFTFTAPNGKNFNSGSQATILVPSGWTAPQSSNSANPGYISVVAGSQACTVLSIGTITGSGPWTIPINMVCPGGKQFILTYGGGGTKVSAPTTTGLQTFTTKTKKSGGTLTAISASPTIIVKASTTTTVTSSVNPSVFGNSVTFTASALPSTASGTVQFTIDGSNFGSAVTLSGGSATSSAISSLSVGNHPVTAVYSGDSNNIGTLIGGQVVNPPPPVVSTMTWNHKNGVDSVGKCKLNEQPYLHWVLNGVDTSTTYQLNLIIEVAGSQVDGDSGVRDGKSGTYQFYTGFFDLAGLTAYVPNVPGGNQFVISDGCAGPQTLIPEFPLLALPIAAVIGLVLFFQQKKRKVE